MSRPRMYEYFDSNGDTVTQALNFTWSAAHTDDRVIKDEGLAALFKIAAAVGNNEFPIEKAQTIASVAIDGQKKTIDELVAHAKSDNAQFGELIIEDEEDFNKSLTTIAKVFPQFNT